MRPKTKPLFIAALTAAAVLLASNTAFATWTSFEYRNSNGDYRYGIKDGSSRLKLGLGKRKQADKAAKGMNKADDIEEADAGDGGDSGDGGGEGGEEK